MPVGLEIRNSNGNLVIDSLFQAWSFIEKRPVTTNGSRYAESFCRTARITYAGNYPIFAVKPLAGVYCTCSIAWKVGSTWNVDVTFLGNTNRTFDVYIFDLVNAPATGPGIGLQVFDDDGKMVFDSTKYQMRFIDVINNLNPAFLTKSYSVPFLVAQNGFYREQDDQDQPGGSYSYELDSFRLSGSNLQIGGATYDIGGGNQGVIGNRNYLIIDATGLP